MPFCPECRDEFQEWVKVCPDCGVNLVDQLPAEPEKPAYEPGEKIVTIATYRYPPKAHLAAAALNSEGIQAVVVGEHAWNLFAIAGFGVKLQVKESDADRAIEMLKSMDQESEEQDNDSTQDQDDFPEDS